MKRILLFAALLLSMLTNKSFAQIPQYTYTTTNCGDYVPFGVTSGWGNYKVQILYFPGDFATLPAQPGFITAVYFQAYWATGASVFNNLTVSIGNTALTTLTTTFQTGLTVGYGPNNFSLGPVTANQWFKIDFPTPVYVDASQPFIIEVSTTGGSGGFPVNSCGAPKNPAFNGRNTRLYGPTPNTTGFTGSNYTYACGLDFFAGYPCTDVPKSNVLAPDLFCPNKGFKVQPETFYADATYDWEYSDDGTTWNPYLGPVGLMADFRDSITATRWYRCKITCIATGLSYMTPAKKVEVAPFYYCYCDNGAAISTGLDVGNVKMIAQSIYKPKSDTLLDNGNASPPTSNVQAKNTYSTFQYSIPPIKMYRDSVYALHVSRITSAATAKDANVSIFIDLDRDGVFDASDKVFQKQINSLSLVAHTEIDTITIPMTAEIGLTGMRVIMRDAPNNPDSCGYFGEGETEDYLVDMRYEPCKGPQNPGTVDPSDTSLCTGYDYVVADTTYEKKKSEITRYWQVSGDNINWNGITGSTNKDMLPFIFTGQPLYYRVRNICEATADTTYTDGRLVNAKAGYKCYCYSQAEGISQDSSDIGGIRIGDYTYMTGGPHTLNPDARRKRTDHTDGQVPVLYIDSTYNMYVYHTMRSAEHADAKVTIFMDFNNNKQYDLPYERVYTGYTGIGNFTVVDPVTIPKNVITNIPTGLRVILNNDLAPNVPSDEACGAYTSGETEDFIVEFRRNFPAGVNGLENEVGFNMFPNPTTGKFVLQYNSNKEVKDVTVTVTGITGQKVFEKAYQKKDREFSQEIDLSEMPRGVYYVELNAGGEKMMQKLTVK